MASVKKIAVFGGSGMTGVHVLEEALQNGLSVRALLRPTSELPSEILAKIEVVRGDVTDPAAVKNTIIGTDGVVIVLGTRNKTDATTVMSTGVQNAVTAMAELGIRPITVCLSSFQLLPEDKVPPIFHDINREHGRMFDAVKQTNLDWVAVMPPHIAAGARTEFLVKEDALPGGRVVTKKDLAKFLIDALSKPDYYKKRMAISSVL